MPPPVLQCSKASRDGIHPFPARIRRTGNTQPQGGQANASSRQFCAAPTSHACQPRRFTQINSRRTGSRKRCQIPWRVRLQPLSCVRGSVSLTQIFCVASSSAFNLPELPPTSRRVRPSVPPSAKRLCAPPHRHRPGTRQPRAATSAQAMIQRKKGAGSPRQASKGPWKNNCSRIARTNENKGHVASDAVARSESRPRLRRSRRIQWWHALSRRPLLSLVLYHFKVLYPLPPTSSLRCWPAVRVQKLPGYRPFWRDEAGFGPAFPPLCRGTASHDQLRRSSAHWIWMPSGLRNRSVWKAAPRASQP